ncbi:4-hydroxy-tetrahydrodipicolinate synthase [Piscirickettsia litoralis]|uniref:4-hydroxy-tetrahydrodipicolinate synthase n=1 Tax=Piscirickettsia litoralis TaxID=1891921 RepID=A0ABX3A7Z5_9GAMM|nr:4-hydroxy-tetrahydrodipicolinate synthase [Piscirickettsia litoralis]ODN43836.1 4-hydroxy-tetrahydrodipicolinate synthase [Piscirickettsia litoralis]
MIKGSIVALVTPMTAEGQLDIEALRGLAEWHVQSGTSAIVAMGTTGEASTLTADENRAVLQHVVEQVAGRIPVIAGTGSPSTQATIEKTQAAHSQGVDACLLVTPYYNKPTQEGLYQHFKTIAESVAIPFILYNVPGRTQCDLSVETTARLSKFDAIVGVKDATADLTRVAQLRAMCSEGFALYSGDDPTAREFIQLGGHGVISVTANTAPVLMQRMCDALMQGDFALAERIDNQLLNLHHALFSESNPIPVKYVLHKMQRIAPGIRLPLTWLSEEKHSAIDAEIRQLIETTE